MSKKIPIPQYVKAVQVSNDRGIMKHCQLCSKEFGKLLKEHQCKRCKRAVCDLCSPFKAVVQKYEDSKGHRQCNFCKQESDLMKKFIVDHEIAFKKDTIAIQWLQAFGIDQATAKNVDLLLKSNQDYKQAEQDYASTKDQIEVHKMRSEIKVVMLEVDEWSNFSLREFFHLVVNVVQSRDVVERILSYFLAKYPQVGWSPDLPFITQFLLCFATESVVFQLLTIIYGSIIPPYLYNSSLRTQQYDLDYEFEVVMTVIETGLRIQPADANSVKSFFQNSILRYIPTLTINLLLFETTFFVINQMLLGGKEAYSELIKCLASVISQQAKEIKKLNFQNEVAEMFILKNVGQQQSIGAYLKTKQINLENDKLSASKFSKLNIQSRSVSVALQKDLAFLDEKQCMKIEMLTIKQTNEMLQSNNDIQQGQIVQARSEIKNLFARIEILGQEYQTLQELRDNALEQNQCLKLEIMSNNAKASLFIEDFKQISYQKQLISNQALLEDQIRLNFQTLNDLQVLKEQNKILKLSIIDMQKNIFEKDLVILNQRQDIELLNINQQDDRGNSSENKEYNQILIHKNNEISKLICEFQEQKLKTSHFQLELSQTESEIKNKELSDLREQIKSNDITNKCIQIRKTTLEQKVLKNVDLIIELEWQLDALTRMLDEKNINSSQENDQNRGSGSSCQIQ